MIEAREAIRAARKLIGTPYGVLDCIGLIVRVIRTVPGGVPGYKCQGTNWLWRSEGNAAKYRDLTWRQEGLDGAKAGMLAFKRDGDNIHHVGLVTGEGTVIHSSSAKECVVETELGGTWQMLARHRYIETGTSSVTADAVPPSPKGKAFEDEEKEAESMATLYRAMVTTESDPLRVRSAPETGRIIGHVPRGCYVDVLSEGEWPRIRYGETVGYACGVYLTRVEDEGDPSTAAGGPPPLSGEATAAASETTALVREDGVCITLAGRWRVASD